MSAPIAVVDFALALYGRGWQDVKEWGSGFNLHRKSEF